MTGPGVPLRWLDAWGDPLGREAATRVGTFAFLLLVGLVAFFDLGARSLHTLDLPRFGVLAREMIRTGEWLVPHRYGEIYANKPPLEIWLIAAPSVVFGEVTPFLVRLPSALGLVLMVLATSSWGRIRTRSLAVGRTAALLLLGTYAITRFGREGRPDMLASGLAVAGTVLLDKAALGKGGLRDVLLSGVLLGLALLTKGPALLLLPLLVLLLPGSGRSLGARWASARPHLALLVALGVAALWFAPAVLEGGWAPYGRVLLLDQATERIGGAANHQEPWFYYLRRLVDGGAPFTPVYLAPLLLLAFRGGRRALGATGPLVQAALLALVLFSLVPTKHLRYVLFVFPLLGLAAGYLGVRLLLRPAGRWWSKAMPVGGALLALVAAVAAVAGWTIGTLLPVLVPASGLALLAIPAFGWKRTEPGTAARRRLLGSTLVAVALLLVAYWTVRTRYRERALDVFDRTVAEAVAPGGLVYTLAPLEPAHVFHGLPGARFAREAGDLPTRGAYVLLETRRRAEVEARLGPSRQVLELTLGDDGPPVLLLAFPP